MEGDLKAALGRLLVFGGPGSLIHRRSTPLATHVQLESTCSAQLSAAAD